MRNQINKLVEISYALKPTLQEFRSFHVAGIFLKNRLVSLATNTRKTHPKAIKYGYPWANMAVHAECLAVIRGKLEDYSNHSIIVLRIDNQNKLNLSQPCKHCEFLLKRLNFNSIVFSNKDGNFEKYS